MGAHLVEVDGRQTFQSDKYPTCPPGKVPLSVKDPKAQGLLWLYAQRRREVDAEFADDLESALLNHGYIPVSAAAKKTQTIFSILQELAQPDTIPLQDYSGEDLTKLANELVEALLLVL